MANWAQNTPGCGCCGGPLCGTYPMPTGALTIHLTYQTPTGATSTVAVPITWAAPNSATVVIDDFNLFDSVSNTSTGTQVLSGVAAENGACGAKFRYHTFSIACVSGVMKLTHKAEAHIGAFIMGTYTAVYDAVSLVSSPLTIGFGGPSSSVLGAGFPEMNYESGSQTHADRPAFNWFNVGFYKVDPAAGTCLGNTWGSGVVPPTWDFPDQSITLTQP